MVDFNGCFHLSLIRLSRRHLYKFFVNLCYLW